jgi:hypothetical protein
MIFSVVVNDPDRRRFRRVQAPVLCRPVGRALFGPHGQPAVDISQGGIRLYCDEALEPGEHLEIELFLPDQSTITCQVEVVWIDTLTANGPAKYDVGMKFIDAPTEAMESLAVVLERGDAKRG